MKRGIAILTSLPALAIVLYFMASIWAIRHETMTFVDASRDNRPVQVDIAVRRDREMEAGAGLIKLPVAILNHGNAVKLTEYSFLADVYASRGYIAISIQNDLPTDAPMVTKAGELYVGRLTRLQRGVANIRFAVEEMKKLEPNADYDHLTLIGHSMGGDTTMYFAKEYPDRVAKVVTLDNLRVPFVSSGKSKILSFRSKDPLFETDPGVLVPAKDIEDAGITIVKPRFEHNDLSVDREAAKESIQDALDKFLKDADSSDLQTTIDLSKQPKSDLANNVATTASGATTSPTPAVNDDAACRKRLQRLGTVTKGPCIEIGEVVENLEKGVYNFNKPETAYVGETFEVRLILQTSKDQSVSYAFAGLRGPLVTKEGQFGQSIEAALHGADLKIEPAGPQVRTATTSEPVEWSWNVTPQSEGQKALTIDVAVNIQVESDKHRVQMKPLHEVILIQVSTYQWITRSLGEVKSFMLAAAATGMALVTLIGVLPPIRKAWRGEGKNEAKKSEEEVEPGVKAADG